jgi:hypothetical protein
MLSYFFPENLTHCINIADIEQTFTADTVTDIEQKYADIDPIKSTEEQSWS